MNNPAKQPAQKKPQYKLHYFADNKYCLFLYYI